MHRLSALFLLVVIACGPAARPVPPTNDLDEPETIDCDARRSQGTQQHDAGDFTGAIATYRAALPACPNSGLHNELGYSLAALGRFDEAALEYITELRGAQPPAVTFGNLSTILDKLSVERRTEIARLGGSKEAPLSVPDIGAEYAWLDRFVCLDGRATRKGQSLVEHRGRKLDVLLFACADGVERMVYFDFSADSRTKAFQNELGSAGSTP